VPHRTTYDTIVGTIDDKGRICCVGTVDIDVLDRICIAPNEPLHSVSKDNSGSRWRRHRYTIDVDVDVLLRFVGPGRHTDSFACRQISLRRGSCPACVTTQIGHDLKPVPPVLAAMMAALNAGELSVVPVGSARYGVAVTATPEHPLEAFKLLEEAAVTEVVSIAVEMYIVTEICAKRSTLAVADLSIASAD